MQRDLVKAGPEGWGKVLGTAFTLRMGSAFALYASYAVIIIATTPNPQTRTACLIVGLSLILNPSVLFRAWFQSQVAAKYAVLAQNAGFTLATAARIYLLYRKEATVYALAWIFVLELALGGVLVATVYGWVGQNGRGVGIGAVFTLVGGPAKLRSQLLSGLAIFAYMRIDQIMLEKMAGSRAVGIYSAAVKISEIGYFIPVMLGATLLPSLVPPGRATWENTPRAASFTSISARLSPSALRCRPASWRRGWCRCSSGTNLATRRAFSPCMPGPRFLSSRVWPADESS